MNELIHEIRDLILSARRAVAHSVDLIQMLTNFEIGRCIIEHEQGGEERAQYGKALLKELSAALTAEFGRGFSRSNLEYMRKFYLTYQDRATQIAQTPSVKFLADEKSQMPSGKSVTARKSHLVFYNRLLRCYVLLDLKIGKLNHGDLGQMQMYVNYFDRHVKLIEENPTVGIVLCKKKHDALVEITLPKDANIHAREYQLYLPDKALLRQKLAEWGGEVEE